MDNLWTINDNYALRRRQKSGCSLLVSVVWADKGSAPTVSCESFLPFLPFHSPLNPLYI